MTRARPRHGDRVAAGGDLATLDHAARQLGVSRRTLARWLTASGVKAYTIAGDGRRYVDMDEPRRLREPKPVEPGRRLIVGENR
jgi:hypothetical protein